MFKIDKKYLPSKNFLLSLSIAIGIVVIAIIINYWKPSTTKYINKDLILNASSTLINIDLDSDGLPDWKENLYGTNPTVSDTDGDGTSDLDELSQDRDPLKSNTAKNDEGPTDKIDEAIVEENKKILEEYKNLNQIDKFSRTIFSNIIASQPINKKMDQDTIDYIVAKSVSEIPDKNYVGITKIENLTLLKTQNSDLAKNLADYTKKFYAEMDKLKTFMFDDLEQISSFVTDDNQESRSELLEIAAKYQEVVNNLIKIPVPIAIGYYDVNYHLAIINDLEKIIAIDTDVANSNDDSFGIFSNISIYDSTVQEMITTLDLIDNILGIE